jgi:hypothetical protein
VSEASDARAEGFRELLDADGEELIFRSSVVCGVVNRGLAATALARGEMDYGERNDSVVEVYRCLIEPPPRAGEYFEDDVGDYHRIKVVRKTDITWRLDCEIDSPESNE